MIRIPACGILSACGVEIPEFIRAALTALGLGLLRAGIAKAQAGEWPCKAARGEGG